MAAEMVKRLQSARRRLVDFGAGFLPIDGEPPINTGPPSAKWED
jgi:hypothetical protein